MTAERASQDNQEICPDHGSLLPCFQAADPSVLKNGPIKPDFLMVKKDKGGLLSFAAAHSGA